MTSMLNVAFLGPVFLALAIIFLALAMQDYWKQENKLTPARKTWMRIAMIFAVISVVLYGVHFITEMMR